MSKRQDTINKLEWTTGELSGKRWCATEKVKVGDRVMYGSIEQSSTGDTYNAHVLCGHESIRHRHGKFWQDEQQAWCVNTIEALQAEQGGGETFTIIDIEHRPDGRYYLIAEQWSVERHKVLRRKDLTTSYVTYSKAHRARAAAYEMWTLYEEWRDAQD